MKFSELNKDRMVEANQIETAEIIGRTQLEIICFKARTEPTRKSLFMLFQVIQRILGKGRIK